MRTHSNPLLASHLHINKERKQRAPIAEMNGANTEEQRVSSRMEATPADYDQTQSASLNRHPNEEPMVKPLICSFFKQSRKTASHSLINGRGNTNGGVGIGAASLCRNGDNAASTHSCLPPFPAPIEEPVLLFPLTPSAKVPLRRSKRSGRVLNESETLQEKHAQEYRFIVPMLAYAINCTIAEHDIIRQNAGLPAYISPSPSPASSPTPKRTFSGSSDINDKAVVVASEEGRPRASGGDSAINTGDRNVSLSNKVFETAVNAFSTREVPAISVYDYLKRIVKYTYVSPSVLVCCCLYLDRLLVMYPTLLLHPNNVFKFLITSTRVCSKIMDTRTLNNRDFSVVGGITNDDINALEFMFVQLLQNHLYISHSTFNAYCEPLRRQAAHIDVEREWEGTTLVTVLPVNGNRSSSYPHQPSRPFLARNNVSGSVTSRSRRSSIMSQNEYSLSMGSQSGVSPLRSASRPAFPPSASMGQSISVDVESLATARQPSAAASRGDSVATSARRQAMNSSSTTSRSPLLPQVHPLATANGTASIAIPVVRNVSSAIELRSSGNCEDTASSGGLAQSTNGALVHQPQQQLAFDPMDENEDARARSIPVLGPRGFSSSGDAIRSMRTLTTTTSGVALSASAITTVRCSSPSTQAASTSASTVKNRGLDGTTVSTEFNTAPSSTINSERTPARRALVSSACGDGVALPPVLQSGRCRRSTSRAGNAGVTVSNVPTPPDIR